MKLAEKIYGPKITLNRMEKSFEFATILTKNIVENVAELQPWLGWACSGYTIEESYEYLVFCNKSWDEGTHHTYFIADKEENFIGIISVKPDDNNKSAVFGYWLITSQTKKGYMQEAVILLEKELFDAGLNKLVICTDMGNNKSVAIAQKLGYHLDGILRQERYHKADETFRDINVFSKLKSEYN